MKSNVAVTVIETEAFAKQAGVLWSDAELDDLKDFVARNPFAGVERKMSTKNGKLTDFDKQLIASMEEAVAHARGDANPCRETVVEFADAKAIRVGLGMSQSAFSRAFGIPLKTLQHWEQGRHHPDRTASAYLWAIKEFPDQVRKAQQRHRMQTA